MICTFISKAAQCPALDAKGAPRDVVEGRIVVEILAGVDILESLEVPDRSMSRPSRLEFWMLLLTAFRRSHHQRAGWYITRTQE